MQTIKQFILISILLFSGSAYAKVYEHTIEGEILIGSLISLTESLDDAVKGDYVQIIIHSPGGNLSELIHVITSMDTTKAEIRCYVPYYAASAAAMIFQFCDKRLAEDDAIILFHFSTNTSTGLMDIPRDFDPINPDLVQEQIYKVMTYVFEYIELIDVLTDDEWTDMNAGADIILSGAEYKSRGGLDYRWF